MKLLIVADEEDPYLWDYYRPGALDGIDLILSAGDLSPDYLSFLVTMANRPLLYVYGNHDRKYEKHPPEGCTCIDGRLVRIGGLRILGLGGSMRYNGGPPYQYTEAQMKWRIGKLFPRLLGAKGLDILLTHSPARGVGDLEDLPHQGFRAFHPLLKALEPRYLIHGHIHQRYQPGQKRLQTCGKTTVINANGKYILELP